MGLTLTQRCQRVGQAYRSNPKATVRTIAQQVGIPKSSVHRHLKTIERRQQHEESVFWETTAGEAWLRLLVFGTLYYFGIKQGVGSESLAEFLQFLRLEQRVACSPTALRRLEHQLREQICCYGQQQVSQCHTDTPIGIVVGADETFFDLPVLVLLELSSGFIFTEVTAHNRQYDTWLEQAQPLLEQTRYECRSLVSDAAPALVKLALTGLGCPSIADLFHALRPLTRTIGSALARQTAAIDKRLEQLQETIAQSVHAGRAPEVQPQTLAELSQQQGRLEQAQQTYQEALQALSLTLHPFAIDSGGIQLALHLPSRLEPALKALQCVVNTYGIDKGQESIEHLQQQLPSLMKAIDAWWGWVCEALSAKTKDGEIQRWVTAYLLPWCYWQQQVQRTKTPTLRQTYQQACQNAHDALQAQVQTSDLTPQQWQDWYSWAKWMVSKFQRSTAAIEGRNSCLSRAHQAGRGLSHQTLRVLTIIHNFALKRSDGTTVAQRLFGKPFPDLLDWVMQQMGELPRPRRSNRTASPNPLTLKSVPA